MPSSVPDLTPFWLSLKVASAATLLILPGSILASWWLAYSRRFRGRLVVETLLTLPLVMPPTVVGYYLLLMLGRGTAFGKWVNDWLGVRLIFTWQGAAIAAAVMALPLLVRSATAAFAVIEPDLLEAGRTLGAGEWTLLRQIIIPLSYRGLLAGIALAFARALGEFGATLMVAGSIPGKTQTLPLALYADWQAGDDRSAHAYAILLALIALLLAGVVGLYQRRISAARGER